MEMLSLLVCVLVAIFSSVVAVCVFIMITSERYPRLHDVPSERVYSDGSGRHHNFPSLHDPPSIKLSVIVPAYNEQHRLPVMLDECLGYLEARCSAENGKSGGDEGRGKEEFSYEVLVVDDGSSDGTSAVVGRYTQRYGVDRVRCLTLAYNRGKGGAVRMGVLRSRGETILFADADGASKFSHYAKLETALYALCPPERGTVAESLAVVCGSRAHLEEESVAERSVFRTLLMYGFHSLVWLFTVRNVRDTQCGFKLFTRRAATMLFTSLHIERWAFDVELLVMAEALHIPVAEVAVTWTEIDGSKVTPVLSWLEMGRDLVLIWLRYRLGAWRIRATVATT